jgi:prepilin-type N-terminal cleavage/methylation domain-containing protein
VKNEKGITLIEVLATLAILGIISSLIFGVFIGVNKKYNKISQQNNLEQEANLILTTLKNYHLSNNNYKIAYDSNNNSYYIGTSSPDTLLGSNNLKTLKIDEGVIPNKPNNLLINPSVNTSINVYIQLSNENGEYTFETIIKRY